MFQDQLEWLNGILVSARSTSADELVDGRSRRCRLKPLKNAPTCCELDDNELAFPLLEGFQRSPRILIIPALRGPARVQADDPGTRKMPPEGRPVPKPALTRLRCSEGRPSVHGELFLCRSATIHRKRDFAGRNPSKLLRQMWRNQCGLEMTECSRRPRDLHNRDGRMTFASTENSLLRQMMSMFVTLLAY